MTNWRDYIENELSGIHFDEIEEKQTDFYLYKFYRLNGTYLIFDLVENQKKLRKVEIGKYWPTTDNVMGYDISNVKAVFDKSKKHLINFLQISFDGEYREQFELDFSIRNQKILSQFLKIPLNLGWREKYYKYKDVDYKICIELGVDNECLEFEIILMHFVEQDLPMPGDKIEKRIRTWWADLKRNDSNRKIDVEIVNPIKGKGFKHLK